MSARLLLMAGVALALAAGCGSSGGSVAAGATSVPGAAPTSAAALPSLTSVAGGSYSDVCKTITQSLAILASATTGGGDDLPLMMAQVKRLRALAPSEIRDDLKVIADFDQKVVDQVSAGNLTDIAETPELKTALHHEAAWSATHCTHG